MSQKKKVAILTAGGLAPCLSAAVGQLILHYTQQCPDWDLICYRSGYKGLLKGDSIVGVVRSVDVLSEIALMISS